MVWMLGEGRLDKPPAQLSLLANHESSFLVLQVWVLRACLPIPVSMLNPKKSILIFILQANLQSGSKELVLREDFH